MRLNKISGTNLMGGTFAIALGALNYVHGRNDAGKTRLGNLIKLLLLGRLPGIDNKPRAIFDAISSGKRVEVEGVVDDSGVISRSWAEIGDKIKTTNHVPDQFDGTTPLVLLDPNDYFGRSARGRVEMVFAVANITGTKVEFPEDIARTVRLVGPKGIQEATTMQELLELTLEAVEEARSMASAEVRRYTQTLQGLTELQLNDRPATRSVDAIDADIQVEQHESAIKTARRRTLTEEMEANETLDLERADLEHKIEQAGDPTPKEFDIDALRAREKELAGKARTARDMIDAFERWEKGNAVAVSTKTDVEKRITKITAEIEEAERGRARIAVLEPPPKSEKCSKCGQSISVGTAAHPEAEKIRRRLTEIAGSNSVALATAQIDLTHVEARIVPAPPMPSDDVDVLQTELDQVRGEIDEYLATVEVVAWRKRLAEMRQPVDHTAEIARLATEIEAHEKRLPELRDERKSAESDRQDRKRLAEAEQAQEKAIAWETELKDAKKWLLEKKAALIEQVFGPLLDAAGRFMKGIFPQSVEYREGELGMFNGSTWVKEAMFGGAKRSMLYAALKCALGSQSPLRIIEMDELATIDSGNLFSFLSNVKSAHEAGIFDQFIGMTARFEEPPKGFTTIEAVGSSYVTN